MTTIAWDGTTLAVDRGVWNGRMVREQCKLHVIREPKNGWPPGAYASCGDAAFNTQLVQWMRNGGTRPETAKPEDMDVECGVYVSNGREVFLVMGRGVLLRLVQQKVGSGGGAHFALGCMVAGTDAVTAVELAQKHTDCSAFGIDSWRP